MSAPETFAIEIREHALIIHEKDVPGQPDSPVVFELNVGLGDGFQSVLDNLANAGWQFVLAPAYLIADDQSTTITTTVSRLPGFPMPYCGCMEHMAIGEHSGGES